MPLAETNAEAIALQALVWTLGDPGRATRLLDLTGAVGGDPLVLRVRDDDGTVGERDLVAGTAEHDLGTDQDPGGVAVGPEQEITRPDLAHRRPAVGRRQRRVEVQRFAILLGDLDVPPPVPACTVRPFPAEEGGYDLRPLPIQQVERFTRPFPLGVTS